MSKLTREDLLSLEAYAEARPQFRAEVLEHKRLRQISLGANATLMFEDRLTMRYQVQEMLRAERIYERAGIEEELDAYNPLIPDGSNWKATLLFEFPDVEERRQRLGRMAGIEHRVWARIGEHERAFAIANEDMPRSNDEKTSAVHFLRFELEREAIRSLADGAPLTLGIDHEEMSVTVTVPDATVGSLRADLTDA